jgi:chemotaxis signal transduction protein
VTSETEKDPSGLAGHDEALGGLLESLFSDAEDGGSLQPGSPASDPGRVAPAWADDDFRALLFRVGEFRFAMPLLLMRSVSLLPDRLTRIPGQPKWQLGLVRYRGQSVTVADFGLLIGVQARCVSPRFLLLIGDGRGAIACDEIEDAVLVERKTVRWARSDVERAWLAGLMTEQMCSLVDGDMVSAKIRHG